MEQKYRNRIDTCCESILSKIDMKKLWPKLLEHKIYNRDDVNIPRWTENLTAHDTVKDVYLTMKTRGPKAFGNLLLSLRQSGHENIADILEGKVNNNCGNDISLQHDVQRSPKPLEIKLCKATEFLDRPQYDPIARYPMRSNPRGLVLIITNINYKLKSRPSAEHDEANLKELFEQMGFEIVTERNLTAKRIKEVVRDFSKRSDLEKVDSCFVIFTSHGTEDENCDTMIQGADYSSVDEHENYEKVLCTDIMDYFTAEACPYLAEKPKIFIFQLCRGKKEQKSVLNSRLCTDTNVFSTENNQRNEFNLDDVMYLNRGTRNYADMLVVQSTLPRHVAYRDKINGSWFIQILCKVFMNFACTKHVQDLFNMVDAELRTQKTANDQCQTSCVKSVGFNSHCFINPGLFETDKESKEETNDL